MRIGQESETHVVRFLIRNTIDERLARLQEQKKELVGRALGDTQAFRTYSVEELMRLFGTVKTGEDGKPFIFVEEVGMGVAGGWNGGGGEAGEGDEAGEGVEEVNEGDDDGIIDDEEEEGIIEDEDDAEA